MCLLPQRLTDIYDRFRPKTGHWLSQKSGPQPRLLQQSLATKFSKPIREGSFLTEPREVISSQYRTIYYSKRHQSDPEVGNTHKNIRERDASVEYFSLMATVEHHAEDAGSQPAVLSDERDKQ